MPRKSKKKLERARHSSNSLTSDLEKISAKGELEISSSNTQRVKDVRKSKNNSEVKSGSTAPTIIVKENLAIEDESSTLAGIKNKPYIFMHLIRIIKNPLKWFYYLIGFIATVIAIMQGPSAYDSIVKYFRSNYPADISIRMYNIDRGQILLSESNNLTLHITEDNILRGEIEIPIRLAIRNKEQADLEIVRAEITYDQSLKIKSGAQKIIPEKPGLIIYNHPIGSLPVRDGYTPLDPIDTLILYHRFMVNPLVALSKEGVPMYFVSLIGYDPKAILGINDVVFGITIYCKDHKPFNSKVMVKMDAISIFDLLYPPNNAITITRSVELSDDKLWKEIISGKGYILNSWTKSSENYGFKIDYKKINHKGSLCQLVLVNNIPRRIIVDSDMDGFIEFELIDNKGDGHPNIIFIWRERVKMIDWLPEAVF